MVWKEPAMSDVISLLVVMSANRTEKLIMPTNETGQIKEFNVELALGQIVSSAILSNQSFAEKGSFI
jgi:hypothetical protein